LEAWDKVNIGTRCNFYLQQQKTEFAEGNLNLTGSQWLSVSQDVIHWFQAAGMTGSILDFKKYGVKSCCWTQWHLSSSLQHG